MRPATEATMRLSTRLSEIELRDSEGEPTRLGSLWQERPVVLVFIRHFG
jgi:cytochrome oxidase Cu insertion factor (SCO1/SenC/PrrC family)